MNVFAMFCRNISLKDYYLQHKPAIMATLAFTTVKLSTTAHKVIQYQYMCASASC